MQEPTPGIVEVCVGEMQVLDASTYIEAPPWERKITKTPKSLDYSLSEPNCFKVGIYSASAGSCGVYADGRSPGTLTLRDE